ncbi:hypothetical protein BdWA1_003204 [Babesia duncani]|uniref:Uncharacterized protein n=1 Tax=Babesia duncani TaxID=323732 RepID=A0AAD9PIP4_9APIC|nr:hypothetical protein BdWA1_003204 [Babesia duncani]
MKSTSPLTCCKPKDERFYQTPLFKQQYKSENGKMKMTMPVSPMHYVVGANYYANDHRAGSNPYEYGLQHFEQSMPNLVRETHLQNHNIHLYNQRRVITPMSLAQDKNRRQGSIPTRSQYSPVIEPNPRVEKSSDPGDFERMHDLLERMELRLGNIEGVCKGNEEKIAKVLQLVLELPEKNKITETPQGHGGSKATLVDNKRLLVQVSNVQTCKSPSKAVAKFKSPGPKGLEAKLQGEKNNPLGWAKSRDAKSIQPSDTRPKIKEPGNLKESLASPKSTPRQPVKLDISRHSRPKSIESGRSNESVAPLAPVEPVVPVESVKPPESLEPIEAATLAKSRRHKENLKDLESPSSKSPKGLENERGKQSRQLRNSKAPSPLEQHAPSRGSPIPCGTLAQVESIVLSGSTIPSRASPTSGTLANEADTIYPALPDPIRVDQGQDATLGHELSLLEAAPSQSLPLSSRVPSSVSSQMIVQERESTDGESPKSNVLQMQRKMQKTPMDETLLGIGNISRLSKDKAKEWLKRCQEELLLLQSQNSKDPIPNDANLVCNPLPYKTSEFEDTIDPLDAIHELNTIILER